MIQIQVFLGKVNIPYESQGHQTKVKVTAKDSVFGQFFIFSQIPPAFLIQ